MTIGAHRKLRAIIAALPAGLVIEVGNGVRGAILEEHGMRLSWSEKHEGVTVYDWSTGRAIWHGNERRCDVDNLQASVLDSLLMDLRRVPASATQAAAPPVPKSLVFIGRTGRAVYQ